MISTSRFRTADAMRLLPAPGQFHHGPPKELILNGAIGSAFARDRIHCDAASGGFHASPVNGDVISVTGTGLRAEWTRRAIARLGLALPATAIEVTEDAFSQPHASGVTRFDSLSRMHRESGAATGPQRMFLDCSRFNADRVRTKSRGRVWPLQKPSIKLPSRIDLCFVGVFHTLNQRRAQLYH